ncbi:MAG TPA: hypothetical protein VNR36_09005 [Pseudolysinimonas sp.]|nr:hypothetical protein [Pseudolysinimonas sp.]
MSDRVVVRVTPRRSLLTTAFISIVLAMIPVFGVLYWFSLEHDSWIVVFIVHLGVLVLAAATLIRQLTVFSAVTSTELIGRGIFSPLIRVPLSDIASVDLIETYIGQAPETATQLLVRDSEGRRLFRMRGNFYEPGDLQRIAAALPVKTQAITEPIPIVEFFRTYPGSAYWFEHRPVLRAVVFALALVAALGIGAWVMTILGMPVGLSS